MKYLGTLSMKIAPIELEGTILQQKSLKIILRLMGLEEMTLRQKCLPFTLLKTIKSLKIASVESEG